MVWLQTALVAAALSGTGQTELIDFSATWCGPCRQMEPVVAQLAAQGYPIRKVDIDRDRELAARHRVSRIPCFVMLVDGREVDRVEGPASPQRLVQMFSAARQISAPAKSASPQFAQAASHSGRGGRRPTFARGQSPDPSIPQVPRVEFPAQPSPVPFANQTAAGAAPTFASATTEASPRQIPAASPPPIAKQVAAPESLSARLLAASVRLKIEDPSGNSVGSGTIIDARSGEGLVLTCGHVFRASEGKGAIHVDLFTPTGPRTVDGQLVGYDLERDIGLVSIRPGVDVVAAPLAASDYQPRPGDSVVSVGCDNGHDPSVRASRINSVDKFLGPPNLQVAGQPVEGRSGGGLFTPDGRVIGVCNAADPHDNEGLFAALGSIRAEVQRLGLSELLAQPSAAPAVDATVAAIPAMPERMPRALDREVPQGMLHTSSPGAEASLTDALRAAEASAVAGGAEVICIVRPHADPRGKSQVIVLDRASNDLLRQLSADRQAQEAKRLTPERR